MTLQKLKSGRVPTVAATDYVGRIGTIFYNEALGDLRLSDGVTPGGVPLHNSSDVTFGLQLTTAMTNGILEYTLPSIPAVNTAMVFVNGVAVEYTLVGANITITEYTSDEIDSTDTLTVYYQGG